MTNEEIKKILYNYPKINSWIKDYEADLDNIREQLDKHYSVNASVISDMPRGTDTSDKTLDKVIAIDRLKGIYRDQANITAKKIAELYEQKRLVEYILPLLNPTEQFIIENRYFAKLTWDDVTVLDPQHRTETAIHFVHKKMFKEIERLLKEKES